MQVQAGEIINTLILVLALLAHAYYFGAKIGRLEAAINGHKERINEFNAKFGKFEDRISVLEKGVAELRSLVVDGFGGRKL